MEALNDAGSTFALFAILAVMLVDRVLLFAGRHPTHGNGDGPNLTKIREQISDLHEVHMATDEDGVAAIPRLAQNSRKHTTLLTQIAGSLDNVRIRPLDDTARRDG